MPDHDVAGFRRALGTLSRHEHEVVMSRCAGMTLAQIAARRSVTRDTIKNQVTKVIERMRAAPELQHMAAHGVIEAICYRLGYEQALADIEAQVARKRAA
ncbi:MAG: hypothetical protein KC442_03385 [Thermomicrobiales bacterium]|nr:hypothetical protein [Thermomicrobiales bacterium]